MTPQFRTRLGQVVLLERGDEVTTGIVVSTQPGEVVLDLTTPPTPELQQAEVSISVFAPEALYKAVATALVGEDRLVTLVGLRDIDVVQRRQWPRHELSLPVSLVAVDDARPIGVTGHTLDLGIGGAKVHTAEPIPDGSDPMVTLTLPEGDVLLLNARVVHTARGAAGFDYGLAFRDLDEDDVAHLSEVLAKSA
jgi:hypothetical protein